MVKIWTISILFLYAPSSFAESFVVLFKQSEPIPLHGKANVSSTIQSLQRATKEGHERMKNWLEERSRLPSPMQELWIAGAVVVELSNQDAKALELEPWIHTVIQNTMKKYIDIPSTGGSETSEDEQPWGLVNIGLPQVREALPDLKGKGIRVGILDTGIQSRHPSFAEHNAAVIFKDFVSNLPFPYDDHGHGTHVAGTISGTDVGIAPQVELTVAKVFTAGGGATDGAILEAMQWMLDPDGDPLTEDHPLVINNSWGLALYEGIIDINKFLHFRRAVRVWAGVGIVPIFSAGNSGSRPNGIPAGFPESVAVGATASNGTIADFSSMGPNIWQVNNVVTSLFKPELSAPGVDVRSSLPGNTYDAWSGTSMAAPHVTGAVALFLEKYPDSSNAQVISNLIQSVDSRLDLSFGHGLLNLPALLGLEKARLTGP